MIKIDTGVKPLKAATNETKYPFADMLVGDSFLIPKTVKRQTVHNCATSFCNRKRLDWKFRTGMAKDGLRIWRIK